MNYEFKWKSLKEGKFNKKHARYIFSAKTKVGGDRHDDHDQDFPPNWSIRCNGAETNPTRHSIGSTFPLDLWDSSDETPSTEAEWNVRIPREPAIRAPCHSVESQLADRGNSWDCFSNVGPSQVNLRKFRRQASTEVAKLLLTLQPWVWFSPFPRIFLLMLLRFIDGSCLEEWTEAW